MKKVALSALLVVFAAGCGGADAHREKEAVAIAAVAGAAQMISLARSQNPDAQRSAAECCSVCDRCTFPCGDRCLPHGSLCMKPKGCACYASDLPVAERSYRLDYDVPCTPAPVDDQTPVTPIVPIISY